VDLFDVGDAEFLDGFTVGDVTEGRDSKYDQLLFILAALQHVFTCSFANELHHSSLCAARYDPRTCPSTPAQPSLRKTPFTRTIPPVVQPMVQQVAK